MGYYADVGPKTGPILWKHGHHAIAVLESPSNHVPIGMALGCGWGAGGVHVWRLVVHGVEVPGRWIVVGREFWPEEMGDRAPR
jgi:hypothetical protein